MIDLVIPFSFLWSDEMSQYFENDSSLKSNIQKTTTEVFHQEFTFFTDSGVFAKKGLDFGSRLLIENIQKEDIKSPFLDVGCGVGVLGIILNKIYQATGDMIDINLRALHLAKRNVKENACDGLTIFESDCYQQITGKYPLIMTNPPIRAGKRKVYEILEQAKEHLTPDGTLYFVIRKEQGAKTMISDMEKIYHTSIIIRKKGFFIVKCKN